jgi:cytochrome c oxidase subunit 1
MSTSAVAQAPHAASAPTGRRLVPSIITAVLLGAVGGVVVALIVHSLISGPRQADDTWVSGYIGWFVFFMIGIGAVGFPLRWGAGAPDQTHEQELREGGKGEGVWRYFRFCTDHKVVGLQYFVTIIVLFVVGGAASWMIRLEQARTGAKVFTPSTYNTIVGMHGIVMIASTIIMVSAVFGNYIVPIMIGANDMAFPRLNALSYWSRFSAVPVLLTTVALGGFSTGWTGYAPLADQAAVGMDAYCFTIVVFAISIMLGGINIAATVVTMRAPGMTFGRLPMTVWGIMLSTLLGLIVFPSFMAAVVLVLLDRTVGTSFYQAALGGNNWLYEQLFWFMGHPEVYVIGLPGFGVVCDVVATFSRKPLYGYKLVVGGMIGIFVLGMAVWMHHIYWSGANLPLDMPTMMTTEAISIPTGVIFLALIGTMWRGRIWLSAPMLFAVGFLINFLIGGVTGLYLADVPTDTIFHSNMFVAAHFHFTLVGGAVFAFVAGIYYWFPKMTGRELDPFLSKLHFWLFEIGFLGTFLPLFLAGIKGEPRWQAYISPSVAGINLVSSLFAILLVASAAVFLFNIIASWTAGKRAPANPWGSRTLEWTIPSPPALVNFATPPLVVAGPYDYGLPGPRTMGRLTLAGASDDAAVLDGPPAAPVISRGDQVRYGTILAIVSDVVFVLAMLLGFAYLAGLNTMGQFRGGEQVAALTGTIILAAAAVVAALLHQWGAGGLEAGEQGRARAGVAAAWIITLAALVADLVIFGGLNFATPFHAYASGVETLTIYHGWHLLITIVAGGLVLGRLAKGRLQGRAYVLQAMGYWYWWVAISAVLLVIAMAVIK